MLGEGIQHQVPQEQKEEWQTDVMELQEEVIFDKNEAMKGTVLYAFIEGQVADSTVSGADIHTLAKSNSLRSR